MASLPTYSNMPLSLLDRTESLPTGDSSKPMTGAPIAVPASPVDSHTYTQQPSHYLPSAYGFTAPGPTQAYSGVFDHTPSGQADNAARFQPQYAYHAYSPMMQSQVYGYNVLPTMPPRYSMTGTPFAPPPRGCISPLDLISTPGMPAFTVSAPQTGTAMSFDRPHGNSSSSTGPSSSAQLSFSPTPFTPELSLPTSVPPSALLIPKDASSLGLNLGSNIGLATPVTTFGSDSAPDTNLGSPVSDSEEEELELEETKEEQEDEEDEDEEEEDEMQALDISPKIKVDKIKIKLTKAAKGKKNAQGDDADKAPTGTGLKKRSRTAQACEKCRVRKARCFGGNPCQRCTKRGFTCEFTPSRVRIPPPKVETKPKIRRHSMHTVGGSGSSALVAGQPGVNGIVPSTNVPTHTPLNRVQSHNHVYTQARATPYTRPPMAHAHTMSAGVDMPLASPSFGHAAMAHSADLSSSPANAFAYSHAQAHALTQPMAQVPLPQLQSPAHMSGFYATAFPQIPSFEQMHPSGAAPMPATMVNGLPATGLTPAMSTSSLGLSFGASLPNPSIGQSLMGLGLELDDEAMFNSNSTPSEHSSDLPALSASSASSNDISSGLSLYPPTTVWSGSLDSAALPIVEEDMFSWSPVPENDGVQVVGWDDEPASLASSCADMGESDRGLPMSLTLGQQVEGVRDAAARQLYGISGSWYGVSR